MPWPCPQPVVSAVQSAASYDASGISPGEIVAIYGQGLGPAGFTSLQVNSNGTLSNSIGGVQVFFNGCPSPHDLCAGGAVERHRSL